MIFVADSREGRKDAGLRCNTRKSRTIRERKHDPQKKRQQRGRSIRDFRKNSVNIGGWKSSGVGRSWAKRMGQSICDNSSKRRAGSVSFVGYEDGRIVGTSIGESVYTAIWIARQSRRNGIG